MVIAQIRGIPVYQDPDSHIVTWISGAAVDADGANGQAGNQFAYRYPSNDGLDRLADAGWPHQDWRNVLLDSGEGTPLTDLAGNAYSQTTYVWPNRPISTRYVDATSVPYVVVNPIVRRHAAGVIIGATCTVRYNKNSVQAVVADVSGAGDIGEISIRCAELLGIKPSPLTGGVESEVSYSIFAGQAAIIDGTIYLLQPA